MIRDDFKIHRDAAGRRPRQRPTVTASRPITTRVDPRVWQVVRALCGGDMSRVQVISPTDVRVR